MRQRQVIEQYTNTSNEDNFIRLFEMKTMLEGITDGFFAVNKNWEFTYINKESENLLGEGQELLIGKDIWKSLHYGTESKFYQELHKAALQQISVHFEEYDAEKGKWFAVNAYPLHAGLAVYFKDITAEKEYLTRIEERNKLLTDIAWIQAHRMRGPVANILGLSKLFNYDDAADPVNKEILNNLKTAAYELDDVIKEVVHKTNLTINS